MWGADDLDHLRRDAGRDSGGRGGRRHGTDDDGDRGRGRYDDRRDRRDGRPPPRRGVDPSEPMPELWSIHRARVKNIPPQGFGAFVELSGYTRNALVHVSELASHRVEQVTDVVEPGDEVWVKIIALQEGGKLSASMQYVDQRSGKDLDPSNEGPSSKPRGGGRDRQPIALDAVYKTTCSKCGGKGHLAQECYSASGAKKYDLLPEPEPERPPEPQRVRVTRVCPCCPAAFPSRRLNPCRSRVASLGARRSWLPAVAGLRHCRRGC